MVAMAACLCPHQHAAAVVFGLTGPQAAPTVSEIDRERRSGDLSRAEMMTRQALRVAPEGAAPDRLRFMLAVLLVSQKQGYHEAATLLEAVSPAALGLSDRHALWLARAHIGAGQHRSARKAIDLFLASGGTSEEAYELRLARALYVARREKPAATGQEEWARAQRDALEAATEALVSRKAPPYYQAEGLRLRADALRVVAGDDPELTKTLRNLEARLLVTFPSEDATRRDGLSLMPSALSRSERFKRALNLMTAWDYIEARETFEALRREKYRPGTARWKIAEISIFKVRDDMERGREALATWVRRKDAKGREKATFWSMRAYVKEDRYDDARKLLAVLDEDFKGGPYQERVDFYNAWLWYDQGDCKKALPLMSLYMETWRKEAGKMRVPYSWCLIRQQRWKRAYRALHRELRRDHPLHRGRALYWQAYALDKMGRRSDALEKLDRLNARFPLSHYGMLGLQLRAAFEGRDQRASAQPWPSGGGQARWRLEPGQEAWGWPKLSPRQSRRFQRIKELVAIGDVATARAEYGRLRSSIEKRVPANKRLQFIIFMGHQVEDHKVGWQRATGSSFSTKTGMPDPNDPDWMLAYPQAYRPLIEKLGDRYGVPSAFTYGVMRHESAFKPSAISHADAVGALQMIKPTAVACAREMNKAFDWRDFSKPRVGFEYSLFYLGKHLKLWGGLLLPTAASYNAGPSPVARWLEAHQGKPTAFVVEEYVYKEARNYTRRVAEHTLRYLYLYEPDAKRRAPILDALYPVGPQPAPPEEVGY